MVPTPTHRNPCEGLPDGNPCPNRRKGSADNVVFNHHFKFLCRSCTNVHDEDIAGGNLPGRVISNTGANSSAGTTPNPSNPVTGTESTDVSNGDSESNEQPDTVILDGLLAYCVFGLSCGTVANVEKAVLGYFSCARIKSARDVLWDHADTKIIVEKLRRHDSKRRPVKDQHVTDIIEALRKLDAAKKMPSVAILASDLARIPRSAPEEQNLISMCDRMNELEDKVASLTSSVEKNIDETYNLRDKVSGLTTKVNKIPVASAPPVYNDVTVTTRTSMNTSKRGHKTQMEPKPDVPRSVPQAERTDMNSVEPSSKAIPRRPPVGNRSRSPNPMSLFRPDIRASLNSLASNLSHTGEFEKTRYQKRKEQRSERRRQQAIKGTGDTFRTLKAGDPTRHIFIYNVDHDIVTDDLRSYINEVLKADIRGLQQTSNNDAVCKSFKLSVPLSQFHNLLSEESWPTGIRARKFIEPRTQTRDAIKPQPNRSNDDWPTTQTGDA